MTKSDVQPGDIIDVRPLGSALANSKHVTLLETNRLKMKRLVLLRGNELPEHRAPGEITVQCIEGHIEFTSSGKTADLTPNQLIHLQSGELHSVKAIENSSFLLTIFLGKKV